MLSNTPQHRVMYLHFFVLEQQNAIDKEQFHSIINGCSLSDLSHSILDNIPKMFYKKHRIITNIKKSPNGKQQSESRDRRRMIRWLFYDNKTLRKLCFKGITHRSFNSILLSWVKAQLYLLVHALTTLSGEGGGVVTPPLGATRNRSVPYHYTIRSHILQPQERRLDLSFRVAAQQLSREKLYCHYFMTSSSRAALVTARAPTVGKLVNSY